MIEFLGLAIHEPDVVFTDLGLAILAAYFGRRLWKTSPSGTPSRTGAVLMAGLASAAFWGAVFHAFFPEDTATTAGYIAWMPVAFSILAAAATMLHLSLSILAPQLPLRRHRLIVVMYAAAFAVVVLLVDESFSSIVHFYVPALILLLIAAGRQATRQRGPGWKLIASGLFLSGIAASLQQAEVAIHPVYFDHNALYHVVQSVALVALYLGFRRALKPFKPVYAATRDPEPRPG
jgi:hypothetical protein